MDVRALVGLLVLVPLAGCTDGGGGDLPEPEFDEFGLEATATTGLIRGVVVDEAIRPLANAKVAIRGATPVETTTVESGAFGFDGLAPGTYFLEVTKPGYFPVQQSTEVVAGVAEPPMTKVLLKADAATTPFWQGIVFDGYIECTTSVLVLCGAPAILTGQNFTNDRFAWDQYFSDDASHLQAEMTWETTQALSPELYFELETLNDGCEGEDDDVSSFLNNTSGTSPIYATVNETQVENWSIGTECPIWVSIFSGGVSGAPCGDVDPTGTAPGWCVGFTVQQRFTMFFHTFHHYLPHAGWRFTEENPPNPPQ